MEVVNNIKAIYETPQFKVKDGDSESEYTKKTRKRNKAGLSSLSIFVFVCDDCNVL